MAAKARAPDWGDLVARFAGRKVAVLGDFAADCYVETRPDRLSREAPVMVLRYERRRYAAGCAANTVFNLRALGARPVPVGILGRDEAGDALLDLFHAEAIPTRGLVRSGATIVKVRVVSGDFSRPKQQVLRVDIEPEGGYGEAALASLRGRVAGLRGLEAVIVSDYGYGAATPELADLLRAANPGARLSVDSRDRLLDYKGADLLTPNEAEAAALLRRGVESDAEADRAARELRRKAGAKAVLLTRGNRGMVLFDGKARALPIAGSSEIVDPTGAGDTVVAVATLARLAGADHFDAARMANFAAGVTVMKSGAACVTPAELLEAAARG
ncbi:MAG: bifunctional heptose 7-phosphate kinase/heptose 1-phosphate adenyltransferase [Planctomycetaceae bacterium]